MRYLRAINILVYNNVNKVFCYNCAFIVCIICAKIHPSFLMYLIEYLNVCAANEYINIVLIHCCQGNRSYNVRRFGCTRSFIMFIVHRRAIQVFDKFETHFSLLKSARLAPEKSHHERKRKIDCDRSK